MEAGLGVQQRLHSVLVAILSSIGERSETGGTVLCLCDVMHGLIGHCTRVLKENTTKMYYAAAF